jgi:hypothetical protein
VTEIVKVPFHGSFIHTTLIGAEPHVVLRPTLEGMGLDYSAQLKKLKTRSWACMAETATHDASGRLQNMTTVSLDTWAMLLANVDENRVNAAVRPLVIHYQRESARVLREYWMRSRDGLDYEPTVWTWDETAAWIRQRYGLETDQSQLIRGLKHAGVLKQTGAPRKEYRNLLWFTGSAWNVHPHAIPQLMAKLTEARQEIKAWQHLQTQLELDLPTVDPKSLGR